MLFLLPICLLGCGGGGGGGGESLVNSTNETNSSVRFSRDADGVITDSSAKLQWKEGPNQIVTWSQAQSWIYGLLDGWRNPTYAELQGLYIPESTRQGGKDSGGTSQILRLDPAFQLDTAYFVWAEPKDSSSVYGFDFNKGTMGWYFPDTPSLDFRVFAVRTLDSAQRNILNNIYLQPWTITVGMGMRFNLVDIQVTAKYLNAKDAIVTNVTWSGSGVSGTVFTAPTSTGSVSLECSYTEAGKTATSCCFVNVDRFIRGNEDVITDSKTGLQWFKGSVSTQNYNWSQTKDWVASLSVDGGGWRMPTMNELRALYPESASAGSPRFFDFFAWSADLKNSSAAWYFLPTTGNEGSASLNSSFAAYISGMLATRSK